MAHRIAEKVAEPSATEAIAPSEPSWAVLLAGGAGTGLSHLTQAIYPDGCPKQFATFLGTRSMVQHTYARALPICPPHRVLVVLSAGQELRAREQLPGHPPQNLMVQPRDIDTGPALCLAVARIMAETPRASVVVYPTDHFIHPEGEFQNYIRRALQWVDKKAEPPVILMGAEPLGAVEGEDWLVPGEAVSEEGTFRLHRVKRFVEKPRPRAAQRLFKQGALWNTLIMVSKARTFWHLLRKSLPGEASRIEAFQYREPSGGEPKGALAVFEVIKPFDLSHLVRQENHDHLLLCPLEGIRWRDWGTPEAFLETIEAMGWAERIDEKILCACRGQTMAWRCPKCLRIFRDHVIGPATPISGPVCNACAVPLEWTAIAMEGDHHA